MSLARRLYARTKGHGPPAPPRQWDGLDPVQGMDVGDFGASQRARRRAQRLAAAQRKAAHAFNPGPSSRDTRKV